jgi:hypothetical protein
MRRATAIALASVTTALWSPALATADPVAPQADTPCASALSDVMTWPPGAKMPLVCRAQQWQLVATPQPPNDRWLSYGPAMTLHGEGQRNPSVQSGDWTATPQDSSSQCRAEQQVVVSPGVVGAPQVSEGEPGRPLEFRMLPRLFSIQMSGNCLWTRRSPETGQGNSGWGGDTASHR